MVPTSVPLGSSPMPISPKKDATVNCQKYLNFIGLITVPCTHPSCADREILCGQPALCTDPAHRRQRSIASGVAHPSGPHGAVEHPLLVQNYTAEGCARIPQNGRVLHDLVRGKRLPDDQWRSISGRQQPQPDGRTSLAEESCTTNFPQLSMYCTAPRPLKDASGAPCCRPPRFWAYRRSPRRGSQACPDLSR